MAPASPGHPIVAEWLHKCGQKRTIWLASALLLFALGACRAQTDHRDGGTTGGLSGREDSGKASDKGSGTPVTAPTPVVLGSYPLCEASSALVAPWDSSTVLVADNEERRSLFAFTERDGKLVDQRSLSLPRRGPRDIEAMARVGDQVLVVGSFSRNSRCEVRRNRARMALVEGDAGGTELREVRTLDGGEVLAALGEEEKCLATLFTEPAPQGAKDVCAVLVAAEREAEDGGDCDTLDFEGAVGLPGSPERVWLGLRSPLVNGRAILLRLVQALDEVRFDAVTLLDLDNRSIRALEWVDGEVWGIAGQTAESEKGFRLFSLPANQLVPGATIDDVAELGSLPRASEGLAVVGDELFVVIDGDQGDGPECEEVAGQVVWPLR